MTQMTVKIIKIKKKTSNNKEMFLGKFRLKNRSIKENQQNKTGEYEWQNSHCKNKKSKNSQLLVRYNKSDKLCYKSN